ncbi:MAG: hypothetical protein PHV37_07025 [Candidatus Gastranaerophilales bacterium]|nr:hypothetical protein [Candidatus Gastranaerophilales bacterium]
MKQGKNNSEQPKDKHDIFNKKDIIDKLVPLVENTAMRFNLTALEIDFSKENHRWFLRIYLYSPVRPVTLDDCESVSRSLGDFLDELIPVKYHLEISSPGIERKLKADKEFKIFIDKDISLKLKNAIDDSLEKQFVAKIVGFDEEEKILTIFRYKDKKEYKIKRENIIYAKLYSSEI